MLWQFVKQTVGWFNAFGESVGTVIELLRRTTTSVTITDGYAHHDVSATLNWPNPTHSGKWKWFMLFSYLFLCGRDVCVTRWTMLTQHLKWKIFLIFFLCIFCWNCVQMMTNEPVTRTPHIMFIMFLINVEINIQLQCHVLWKDCNYLLWQQTRTKYLSYNIHRSCRMRFRNYVCCVRLVAITHILFAYSLRLLVEKTLSLLHIRHCFQYE